MDAGTRLEPERRLINKPHCSPVPEPLSSEVKPRLKHDFSCVAGTGVHGNSQNAVCSAFSLDVVASHPRHSERLGLVARLQAAAAVLCAGPGGSGICLGW